MTRQARNTRFPTAGVITKGVYDNREIGVLRQKVQVASAAASQDLALALPAHSRPLYTIMRNDGAVTLATAVRFALGISDNPTIFGLSSTTMTDGADHGPWENVSPGLIFANSVASTTVTNTTDETDFAFTGIAEPSIAANQLRPGDVIRIGYSVIATSTNSTDTLLVNAKVGGVTVSTQVANDVADNDIAVGNVECVVRSVGASGTIVARDIATADVDATAGPAVVATVGSTAIDTTAAVNIALSADWSVAHASNVCNCEILTVDHERVIHPFTTADTTLRISAVSAAGIEAGTLATASGGGIDVEVGFVTLKDGAIPD